MIDEKTLAEVDPGIRDLVRRLNEIGFETTDSGDGVSKPADWYISGEAMPYPNVACVTTPFWMVQEANLLAATLGREWNVEASYNPRDGKAILLATKCDMEAEFRAQQRNIKAPQPV